MSAAAPKLAPFGLVLHHDGRWTHEGHPVTHPRLRAAFDRAVRFLPEEGAGGVYVVQLGRFRGRIELEEAGFFVRDVDLARGEVALSDGTREPLDVASLHVSPIDGALLCRVKHTLAPAGLLARFRHAPQAELFAAALETAEGPALRLRGRTVLLPGL